MKKKTEKVHFKEQWDEMESHLKSFIAKGDQEELHLFRVQVKKLTAMLTLLDASSSKHQLLKDFKPVKLIFKHCGNIRNAYINLQLGVRYKLANEEFVMAQLYNIEKGTNDFQQQAKKYLKIIKTAHSVLVDDLKSIDNDLILEFYKTKMEQIAVTLNDLEFDETLHNCRKQIKILMYNRKIAQKALIGKLEVNNDYLDKLQGNIGDWHDNVLAIELFSTPEANDKAVVTKIKRQNTRLKKSIAILTLDFRNKATMNHGVLEEVQKSI
jgi:CHAD domain-containing protein